MITNCSNCEKEFKVRPNKKKRNNYFCCRNCYLEFIRKDNGKNTSRYGDRRKTKSTKCDYCGIKIYRIGSVIKERNFCSRKCYRLSTRRRGKVCCSNCGKKMVKVNSYIKKNKHHFCSKKCQGKFLTGENNPSKRPEVRKKLSMENNPAWLGGISFEPYGLEFNNKLREKIRKRDNFCCQQCFRHQNELRTKTNKKYRLHVHHIDYNKKNNNQNNLISLCIVCHLSTSFDRLDWANHFKNKGGN